MKKIIIICFALLCIAQIAILGNLTNKGNQKGRTVFVKCTMYDPYHPFKGRYLQLNIDYSRIYFKDYPYLKKIKESLTSGFSRLYLTLNDKYEIVKVSDKPPAGNELFIKGKYDYSTEEYLQIKFLFDKYYMQEDLAPKAESFLRQNNAPDIKIELSVDKEGNSKIINLLANGKRIEEAIQ